LARQTSASRIQKDAHFAMDLRDKVVIITGASEGIGAACAAAFHNRGALLSLTARSGSRLRAAGGHNALITAGDITDPATQNDVVAATIARYGRVDVLVNNAGVGIYTPAWKAAATHARKMFDVNFFAPVEMTRLVTPHMRKQGGGAIVNVSSIAGKVTLPWLTLYSASKHALCSFGDGLRMELKRDGIRVVTVCPCYVKTEFQSHIVAGEPPRSITGRKQFAITAERCAEDIVRGVERGARTVMTPRAGWLFVAASRLLPGLVDWRLERMNV
jgi:hypothetical protein